jgi:hypothetical protein
VQLGSPAKIDRGRHMTNSDRKSLLGKWRITRMEMWGTNYVDMLGPAYIQIDDAGSEMTFAAVQIGLRYEYGETSIWFRFNGSDEMDEVSGDGDAELAENGTLNGEIRFDNGDESSFTAKRW